MDALDLKQCTMRETIHLNGGSEWFGYVFVCNEHPRLQRVDKCNRRTKTTAIQYKVDGNEVASLDEAADLLSRPPVVTSEMQEALDIIGPEFGDHRKTLRYEMLRKLADCGLIEWGDRGKCRVVPK